MILYLEVDKTVSKSIEDVSNPQQVSSSCQTVQQSQQPPCCCEHVDYDDDADANNNDNYNDGGENDDYDDVEGRYSPKKVTFSDYDQVKLMSMESLLSAATSDASTMDDPTIINTGGQMMGLPRKIGPTVVLQDPVMHSGNQTSDGVPKRNQKAPKKSRLV